MSTKITGGCRCGAVRYECSAEPVVAGHCHCRQCQRASGAGHVSVIGVPKHALKVTGEVRYFDHVADSGNTASNGFCPTCGSHLLGHSTGMPEIIAIKVGTLDDPGLFGPGMSIFTARAQPWDTIAPKLPAFNGMPEMPVS